MPGQVAQKHAGAGSPAVKHLARWCRERGLGEGTTEMISAEMEAQQWLPPAAFAARARNLIALACPALSNVREVKPKVASEGQNQSYNKIPLPKVRELADTGGSGYRYTVTCACGWSRGSITRAHAERLRAFHECLFAVEWTPSEEKTSRTLAGHCITWHDVADLEPFLKEMVAALAARRNGGRVGGSSSDRPVKVDQPGNTLPQSNRLDSGTTPAQSEVETATRTAAAILKPCKERGLKLSNPISGGQSGEAVVGNTLAQGIPPKQVNNSIPAGPREAAPTFEEHQRDPVIGQLGDHDREQGNEYESICMKDRDGGVDRLPPEAACLLKLNPGRNFSVDLPAPRTR